RRGAGKTGRDAVRQPPLARRAADELADDLRPDRPAPRPDPAAGRRAARAAAAEGAHRDAGRAREAAGEPRRRDGHEAPAGRDVRPRSTQGAARRARGPAPGHADRRAGRHELRPRRGRLRDPRQRRRDPLVLADHSRDRRRHRGGEAEGEPRRDVGASRGAGARCRDRPWWDCPRGVRRRAGRCRRGAPGGPGVVAAAISAGQVKELRERTGAGMMDCKRALEDTGGDLEEAVRLLREKGIAQAAKRSGRETTEGRVALDIEEARAAMVAVGCETEPVSNNEEFLIFVQRVLDAVEKEGAQAAAELEDERVELTAKLGENIVVRDAVRFEAQEGEVLAGYVHPPANKIGVLIHGKGNPDVARPLAMHISFAAPLYLTRAEVPAAEVDAEREILLKQPDVESKPEEVRGKIVEGRIQKWLSELVLEDQEWIHESGKKAGQALKEADFEVIEFRRFALAE